MMPMRRDVSVVIPAFNEAGTVSATLQVVTDFLADTGFVHEVIVVDDGSTDATAAEVTEFSSQAPAVRLLRLEKNQGKGSAVRRGVAEAAGDVIAFLDADLPYSTRSLGDALALVHAGTTDIAIGARDLDSSTTDPSYPLIRRAMGRAFSLIVRFVLTRDIADTQCGLKAFSKEAAKLLFGESKLKGFGFDFEILFLAKKYGFRIERLPVALTHRHHSRVRLIADSLQMLVDVFRVRLLNRRLAYRPPRRCPVCFSSEVWSLTQIRGHVIRNCKRCKCRYLSDLPSADELETLYTGDYFASTHDLERGYDDSSNRRGVEKTNQRRLALLRRHLPPGARILEIGAGTGSLGEVLSADFDYVGIDVSPEAVRLARGRGIEVYRASVRDFVNTGAAFDAATAFHVFEHLPDPHDSLARIRELVRPGGLLVLVTPNTESLLCSISRDRWVSYKVPEHVILYSRSALIELLEHSGFELLSVGSDSEYCEHEFLAPRLAALGGAAVERAARLAFSVLPDPVRVPSGSVAIVARRRSGSTHIGQQIRAVEPTHAR